MTEKKYSVCKGCSLHGLCFGVTVLARGTKQSKFEFRDTPNKELNKITRPQGKTFVLEVAYHSFDGFLTQKCSKMFFHSLCTVFGEARWPHG